MRVGGCVSLIMIINITVALYILSIVTKCNPDGLRKPIAIKGRKLQPEIDAQDNRCIEMKKSISRNACSSIHLIHQTNNPIRSHTIQVCHATVDDDDYDQNIRDGMARDTVQRLPSILLPRLVKRGISPVLLLLVVMDRETRNTVAEGGFSSARNSGKWDLI